MPRLPRVSSRQSVRGGDARVRSRRSHYSLCQCMPCSPLRHRNGHATSGWLCPGASRAAVRMLNSATAEPFDDLDRLSPEALRRWWVGKLQRALRLAFEELPFYRERFTAAEFDPAGFRSFDDLRAVPICNKEDLLAFARGGGGHQSY